MRTNRLLCLLALALACMPAAAAGPVQVVYVDPKSFTDLRDGALPSPAARNLYLAELKRYLEARGAARVPAGETLVVTITDINLAGTFEPLRHPPAASVRVISDVYPARIDLQFRLARPDGTIVREGERRLRSVAYPTAVGITPSDPLRYEKVLLDDWLGEEFPRPVRP